MLWNCEMDQQRADSKVGEYRANTDKSMALLDSNYESLAPKSVTNVSGNMGPTGEASKICGSKRTTPDCPVSNSGNGHLVYVRRRADVDSGKSVVSDCLEHKIFGKRDDKVQQEVQMKESSILVPETLEIPKGPLLCFLPTTPTVVSSPEKCCKGTPSNFSNVHLLDTPKRAKLKQWEERYCQLQSLLNSLDQSKQEDYIQMLNSLSSVELSKHAVELEKRSIQLAVEEAKEIRWVKVLDVMGKEWNYRAS